MSAVPDALPSPEIFDYLLMCARLHKDNTPILDGIRAGDIIRSAVAARDALLKTPVQGDLPEVGHHPKQDASGYGDVPIPNGLPPSRVLAELLQRALAWSEGSRLLGNLRACDMSRAIREALSLGEDAIDVCEPPPGCSETFDSDISPGYVARLRARLLKPGRADVAFPECFDVNADFVPPIYLEAVVVIDLLSEGVTVQDERVVDVCERLEGRYGYRMPPLSRQAAVTLSEMACRTMAPDVLRRS